MESRRKCKPFVKKFVVHRCDSHEFIQNFYNEFPKHLAPPTQAKTDSEDQDNGTAGYNNLYI